MKEMMDEANWKAMYLTLFHGITDAMKFLPEGLPASERLKRALADAEEIYLADDE